MAETLDTAVQGDVNDMRIIRLSGVQDLSAVTVVTANVFTKRQGSVTEIATLTGSLVDPVARTISINLGGVGGWLPTANPGRYRIEYPVTFADGTTLTWPNEEADWITVRAQGG